MPGSKEGRNIKSGITKSSCTSNSGGSPAVGSGREEQRCQDLFQREKSDLEPPTSHHKMHTCPTVTPGRFDHTPPLAGSSDIVSAHNTEEMLAN